MKLTDRDIELGRKYLVLRSAIKGLTHDKQKINDGDFELKSFYGRWIENALLKANEQLREMNKYPIQLKKTDQPTIYELRLGNRVGYFEMNVVEITEKISELLR